MDIIPIRQLPNQSFSITLDGHFYGIALRTTNGVISATIARDGVVIIENNRCPAAEPLIPYRYLEGGAGNFIFTSRDQQLPNYLQFNISQFLAYYTAEELAFFRLPPPSPLPASYFNPLGALPLRFKPIGYVLAS